METEFADRLEIRALVDDWVLFSDSGAWDRFGALWHEDGYMIASWTEGPAADFVEMRRRSFEGGRTSILHFQGAHTADIAGARAVAQTKMQILQRATVHDVVCDVVCTGRFYDFLEKRDGRWGFVHRQGIYEKDRLDPVAPGAVLALDPVVLARFPEGYRHLAYLQSSLGLPVRDKLPGLKGPEVEALYRRGSAWLAGAVGRPRDL